MRLPNAQAIAIWRLLQQPLLRLKYRLDYYNWLSSYDIIYITYKSAIPASP